MRDDRLEVIEGGDLAFPMSDIHKADDARPADDVRLVDNAQPVGDVQSASNACSNDHARPAGDAPPVGDEDGGNGTNENNGDVAASIPPLSSEHPSTPPRWSLSPLPEASKLLVC